MEKDKKATWEKMTTANVIALAVIFFSFAFLFALIFREIPKGNVEIVSMLTGVIIGTCIAGVVSYFFNYKKKEVTESFFHEDSNCQDCGKPLN